MINFQTYGMIEDDFAKHLVGKKFTIITTADIKSGDYILDLNCINVAHQTPAKILSAKKSTKDFCHITWNGKDGKDGRQYSNDCLFGRLESD